MKRSFSRQLLVLLTLLISCKEKAIDPTKRVRPVSLQIVVSGGQYELSWEAVRIVCITSPCPDIADVEAQEYEVQIASSELGSFRAYRVLDADEKSIRIPAAEVGEQLVARIVSKNKTAPPVNSNPVMASTAFLSQSAYYPGFRLSEDVFGGDVTSDGTKAAYSKLVQEAPGTYATPLYVSDLQNEQIITTKLVNRLGGGAIFSSDGKQLAYPSRTEKGLIVYDMATETSRTLPVADATWIGSVAWSPDGKWLAYTTVSNDESRLWKMATSGGQAAIALTPALPIRASNYIRKSSLDWSPDGRFIAVSRTRNDNSNDRWRATVSLYSPDGGGELSYFETQPTWIDTHPSFSPDGKQLAFLSSRTDRLDTSYSLWVRDLTTNKVRQIKLLPGLKPSDDYAPRWIGNERLVFSAVVQGRKGYYSVFL